METTNYENTETKGYKCKTYSGDNDSQEDSCLLKRDKRRQIKKVKTVLY